MERPDSGRSLPYSVLEIFRNQSGSGLNLFPRDFRVDKRKSLNSLRDLPQSRVPTFTDLFKNARYTPFQHGVITSDPPGEGNPLLPVRLNIFSHDSIYYFIEVKNQNPFRSDLFQTLDCMPEIGVVHDGMD